MTIQVGRFGTDLSVESPMTMQRSGDTLTIDGWARASTDVAFAALLQNLNGLTHPDEYAVPIIDTGNADYTGYYLIRSVSVDPPFQSKRAVRYRVTAELVSRFPTVESILTGAERTGSPAPITPSYWVASTAATAIQSIGTTIYGHTRVLRDGAGTMYIYIATDFTDAYLTSRVAASAYYTGAARLKSGSTKYTQIGRDIAATPTSFELSNGLVFVGPPTNTNYACSITFTEDNGDTPALSYDIEVGYTTAGPTWNSVALGAATGIECLRNSPEEVTIRLTFDNGTCTLDISMRKGDRGVRLRFECLTTTTSTLGSITKSQLWGFGWRASAAFTAISADNIGLVETAADADGNKRVLVCTDSGTLIGAASGRVWGNASTTRKAWFGVDVGSADATDGNAFLQDFYCATQSETLRIAGVA